MSKSQFNVYYSDDIQNSIKDLSVEEALDFFAQHKVAPDQLDDMIQRRGTEEYSVMANDTMSGDRAGSGAHWEKRTRQKEIPGPLREAAKLYKQGIIEDYKARGIEPNNFERFSSAMGGTGIGSGNPTGYDMGPKDAPYYNNEKQQKHMEDKHKHGWLSIRGNTIEKLGDMAPTLIKTAAITGVGAGFAGAAGYGPLAAGGTSSAAGTAGSAATQLGEAEATAGLGFHGAGTAGLISGAGVGAADVAGYGGIADSVGSEGLIGAADAAGYGGIAESLGTTSPSMFDTAGTWLTNSSWGGVVGSGLKGAAVGSLVGGATSALTGGKLSTGIKKGALIGGAAGLATGVYNNWDGITGATPTTTGGATGVTNAANTGTTAATTPTTEVAKTGLLNSVKSGFANLTPAQAMLAGQAVSGLGAGIMSAQQSKDAKKLAEDKWKHDEELREEMRKKIDPSLYGLLTNRRNVTVTPKRRSY